MPSVCQHMATCYSYNDKFPPAFKEFTVQKKGLDKKTKYYKMMLSPETKKKCIFGIHGAWSGRAGKNFLGEGQSRLSPEW